MPVAPWTLVVLSWVQGSFAVELPAAVGWDAVVMPWGWSGFPLRYKTSLPRVSSVWLIVVCIKKLQQVKGLNYCITCIALSTVQSFACARSTADGLGCGVAARKSGKENVANTIQILAL